VTKGRRGKVEDFTTNWGEGNVNQTKGKRKLVFCVKNGNMGKLGKKKRNPKSWVRRWRGKKSMGQREGDTKDGGGGGKPPKTFWHRKGSITFTKKNQWQRWGGLGGTVCI